MRHDDDFDDWEPGDYASECDPELDDHDEPDDDAPDSEGGYVMSWEELEETRRQAEEYYDGEHFKELKRTYHLQGYSSDDPSDQLFRVLRAIVSGTRLSDDDRRFLRRFRRNRLFSAQVAAYFERQFQGSGRAWNAVHSSSWWRSACQPEEALRVTEGLGEKESDSRLKSAIFNTRAGAFRDENAPERALEFGTKAVDADLTNPDPHLLLMALAYERRDNSLGDWHRLRADELGADAGSMRREIQRSIARNPGLDAYLARQHGSRTPQGV